MFARFDENPAMTFRVIKETKRYGRTDGRTDARTDGRTDGQRENSIPPNSFDKKISVESVQTKIINSSCICSMCLNCIGKVSNCSIKSCGRS